MAFPIDHKAAAISIHQMVYNRISFLVTGDPNDIIISNYIYELVSEYALCLGIEEASIGLEESYSVAQKSFLADLVSIYLLARIGAESANVDSSRTDGAGTFLSKAQAGSVEVMYEQYKEDEHHSLAMAAKNLYDFYYESAKRKGLKLGCVVDIDDLLQDVYVPFKNFTE